MEATALYEAWSELLQYPADGGGGRIRERITQITQAAPDLGPTLKPLYDYAGTHPETDLEEVFTRTFDSNAERALELGWHLHGENYARGVFMVRMRRILRDCGVEEHGELPDHLSLVLPVLGRADADLVQELIRDVVTPALEKIAAGFASGENPYFGVIKGLARYVEDGCPAAEEDSCDD